MGDLYYERGPGGTSVRYIGIKDNQLWAELATARYNLVRISNLMVEAA